MVCDGTMKTANTTLGERGHVGAKTCNERMSLLVLLTIVMLVYPSSHLCGIFCLRSEPCLDGSLVV